MSYSEVDFSFYPDHFTYAGKALLSPEELVLFHNYITYTGSPKRSLVLGQYKPKDRVRASHFFKVFLVVGSAEISALSSIVSAEVGDDVRSFIKDMNLILTSLEEKKLLCTWYCGVDSLSKVDWIIPDDEATNISYSVSDGEIHWSYSPAMSMMKEIVLTKIISAGDYSYNVLRTNGLGWLLGEAIHYPNGVGYFTTKNVTDYTWFGPGYVHINNSTVISRLMDNITSRELSLLRIVVNNTLATGSNNTWLTIFGSALQTKL
jgi:hypothetical protein